MENQQGFSVVRLLLWLVILAVFAYIAWLILPVYLQDYQVQQALEELTQLTPKDFGVDKTVTPEKLKTLFHKQLSDNGIPALLLEDLTITANPSGSYSLNLKYWVVQPVIGNMNLMFQFEYKQEVKIGTK